MPKLFIGHKPGVGGVVKVMRDSNADPLTTPNTSYGSFYFNSETTKVGYVEFFQKLQYLNGLPDNSFTYIPSGTNLSNCTQSIYKFTSLQDIAIWPSRIINRPYPVVCEYRESPGLGSYITGPTLNYTGAGTRLIRTRATYLCRLTNTWNSQATADYGANIFPEAFRDDLWQSSSTPALALIWDLPAGNNPIPQPPAGAPGSQNTLISPTVVRIGKAGVDSTSGNRDYVIVDSNRVPMRVVKAGQVHVPAGATVDVVSPVQLTELAWMDYIPWSDDSTYGIVIPQVSSFWGLWAGVNNFDMKYAILSDRVRISNNGAKGFTVRYVLSDFDGSVTSGGSQVLRILPDGTTQIKRPGSSDVNPRGKDILLDTRYPYLPIVAEDYIHRDQFVSDGPKELGDRSFTVNFPNDGSYLPFVKFYVEREVGALGYRYTEPMSVTLSSAGPGNDLTYFLAQSSYGSPAVLGNNFVKFYMALTHPRQWNNSSNNWQFTNNGRPVGIRYYVFAIPTSL